MATMLRSGIRYAAWLAFTTILTSCGGGGSPAAESSSSAPVAGGPPASSPSSPASGISSAADLVVSGPMTLSTEQSYRNVTVRAGGTLVAQAGLSIAGTLTVDNGGELQIVGQPLYVQGDIDNSGAVYDMAGIVFGSKTGSNTVHQTVTSHDGKGIFRNSKTAPDATFTGLEIDNTATPVAVTIDLGDGVLVDGAVLVESYVHFVNGILDVGTLNQFVFRTGATATRVNGALLRDGTAQMAKQFGTGASSFTYHMADAVGEYQYSPVTVDLTSNSFRGAALSFNVSDKKHPNMSTGGAPKDYLTRYWRVIGTPVGTYSGRLTFQYLSEDVVGDESALAFSYWNGAAWKTLPYTRSNHRFMIDVDQSSMTDGSLAEVTGRTP